MSKKIKILAAVGLVFILLGIAALVINGLRAWPELPHTPTPLAQLISESDLIVHAQVVKVEPAGAPTVATTNRWAVKAITWFGLEKRPVTTAHLQVQQTLKGRPVKDVVVDYPVGVTQPPPIPSIMGRLGRPERQPQVTTDWNTKTMVVFLYRQRGPYHPVAYAYGTRIVGRKEGDRLLRYISEFVGAKRQRARAEWFVKLIEDPERRWDGAASWVSEGANPGEAFAKLPPDLAARVEAVTFRNELLGPGDELLLRELAPAHRRKVVQRLRKYFSEAARPSRGDVEEFPQPWRCSVAMELLADVAGMSDAFKEGLAKSPYPDFSSSRKRRDFVENYLPAIDKRLRETGVLD